MSRKKTPQATGRVTTIQEALQRAAPRPALAGSAAEKKNYAERLSRHLATYFANALREAGTGQHRRRPCHRPCHHQARQAGQERRAEALSVAFQVVRFL